jgi:polyphosphate:AMP phosphotransferase
VFESALLDRRVSKEEYAAEVPKLREALLEAQSRFSEGGASIALVVAGAEGAGKGETVNTLLEWLDARGIEAHGMGPPTSEEAGRPPLYRFWRRLPPFGSIGVFFGSWYTDPIVDHIFGRIDDAGLDRELDRIEAYERMLADENVIVLKLWLHVSKKRQRKVFEKLAENRDTAWRVTPRDWEYHETYDEFVATSARALRRTDSVHAPWHVIAARDRRHRQLKAGRLLLQAIEKRLDAPPGPIAEPEPVLPPPEVNLIRSIDLTACLDRETYEQCLVREQGRLGRLARRLTESDRAAVLVFEGPDAAGKGGCIRRVVQALDARFYRVVPIAAPTEEERLRPYLWRFWRRLPGQGQFALYDRSWYGRVLVERIEGFCPPEAWKRAYSEINAFEEQLRESGILVFKYWLAISSEEQLRRFEQRKHIGYKRYKLTEEDWRNRDKWLAYESAACDMLERTNTEIARWTPVAANDKLNARIRVLESLCEGLEAVLGPDERPTSSGKRKKSKKGGKQKKGGKRKGR